MGRCSPCNPASKACVDEPAAPGSWTGAAFLAAGRHRRSAGRSGGWASRWTQAWLLIPVLTLGFQSVIMEASHPITLQPTLHSLNGTRRGGSAATAQAFRSSRHRIQACILCEPDRMLAPRMAEARTRDRCHYPSCGTRECDPGGWSCRDRRAHRHAPGRSRVGVADTGAGHRGWRTDETIERREDEACRLTSV
jgi:hypothetical protein